MYRTATNITTDYNDETYVLLQRVLRIIRYIIIKYTRLFNNIDDS